MAFAGTGTSADMRTLFHIDTKPISQIAAIFMDSWKIPSLVAPSPKQSKRPDWSFHLDCKTDTHSVLQPATLIPFAPRLFAVTSAICIEPPRPRLTGVFAQEFCHHFIHISATGNKVTVSAVMIQQVIIFIDRESSAYSNSFLSG